VSKGNPNHDRQGRFSTTGGGGRKASSEARNTVPAVHAGRPASHPLTAPSAAAHAAGQPQTFKAGAPQNRHGYNPIAVDKAIASSNRAGRKIGGREASLIHRLLKGRH
jgi:hypothetical protein